MENIRETLRIVVVGHVDHGKSTLIGRLLYDTKSLPEGAIDRVKRISKEKGKPFEYAYLLDAFEEEQKQGITIDTTQLQFFTEKRDYVIIDAPGHKEFLKNMISGAASAEAAMLIIDAHEGIQEQSKRHGYMLSLLGIRKVYVLVNKMDLIDYSQEKFNEIQREMNAFLNSLNVYPLRFIPISAFNGENITRASEKMTWYDGPSILEGLDLFEKDKGLDEKPLRFPIQDVYKFDNRRIIAGRIESGQLKAGDEILISPGNKTTKVKTIEYWAQKDKSDAVKAGMSVGITVEDEFFNKRGEVISHKNNAPHISQFFKANIFWLGKKEMVMNKTYKLKLTTQEVECKVVVINKVIDATTIETIEKANSVKINDVAEVVIRTKHPVAFDSFNENQFSGRFVLVDGYDVSGGGIISGPENETSIVSSSEINALNRLVSREAREIRNGQKGKVVFITGLSREENLETAIKLEKRIFDQGKLVYFLENNLRGLETTAEIAGHFVENGIILILTGDDKEIDSYKEIISEDDFVTVFLNAEINDEGQIEDDINLIVKNI